MQHSMHTSANATWQTRIRRLIDEHRCHSVYLDVGSNIGVQIRKLYEPSLYVGRDPKLASLARRFKLYDEPTAEEVAAGFERQQEPDGERVLVLPGAAVPSSLTTALDGLDGLTARLT